MVLLGFELGENRLLIPIPVLNPSLLSVQVLNPIKVKKSFALILEDLKIEKAFTYFSY